MRSGGLEGPHTGGSSLSPHTGDCCEIPRARKHFSESLRGFKRVSLPVISGHPVAQLPHTVQPLYLPASLWGLGSWCPGWKGRAAGTPAVDSRCHLPASSSERLPASSSSPPAMVCREQRACLSGMVWNGLECCGHSCSLSKAHACWPSNTSPVVKRPCQPLPPAMGAQPSHPPFLLPWLLLGLSTCATNPLLLGAMFSHVTGLDREVERDGRGDGDRESWRPASRLVKLLPLLQVGSGGREPGPLHFEAAPLCWSSFLARTLTCTRSAETRPQKQGPSDQHGSSSQTSNAHQTPQGRP